MWAMLMEELRRSGEEMAENYFDFESILNSCHSVAKRLAQMKRPLEERKAKLLEAFKYFELE